jgi:UDP-N-acetylglucosamine diphosphorylase / glucose-1-phosphate thymidylyltransferase / UDP-N-acetylgalactosamine diphosphorylase / glucosamine-1-phosphate N-acetyltransferase / galactosamine-1-phosphate N-acetyltransferase
MMATETLCLFEDEGYRALLPLVYSRPCYELRCGALTLRERLALQLPGYELAAVGRGYLQRVYGGGEPLHLLRESTPITFVNGRLVDSSWLPELLAEPVETAVVMGDTLLAARLSPALASLIYAYLLRQDSVSALAELRRFGAISQASPALLRYPWDLITLNGAQIERDLSLLSARLLPYGGGDPQIVTHERGQIFVGPETRLDGHIVLDARDGPILLDGAKVEPFSFIQGPAYLGPGALIASARIRPETSIGPVCRVGGEVEASILQGYSNKHHDGFLGHSFVGEWVNIGAMTTTSDLKNTYGNVKVLLEGQGQVDSGQIKLGCFLADHVKLGIGMHMNGGTVIGTGSNLFGVHTTPKAVPPFIWGGEVFREYRIERMVEVARKVMGRRKIDLADDYAAMLYAVFGATRVTRGHMMGGETRPSREPGHETAELLLAQIEAELARI